VLFSNTKLLRDVQLETRKKSRIKHFIILLLRILSIIGLVLAFARPFVPLSNGFTESKAQRNVMIYIDNSFSMEAGEAYHTKLNQAREKALEIAEGFTGSDKFFLFNNVFDASSYRPLSKKQFAEKVSLLNIVPVSQDYSSVVLRLNEVMHLFPDESFIGFIISDFQESFLKQGQLTDSPDLPLFLLPLEGSPVVNAGIDSVWLDSPVFQQDRQLVVNVRVRNYSDQLYENISVGLYVNNSHRSLATCDVSPGGTAFSQMTFIPTESGIYSCYVQIEDSPVTYDNTMYFSFTLSDAVRVLAVSGKNKLNNALGAVFRNEPLFSFTTVNADRLQSGSVASSDLLILDAVQVLSESNISEISDFVNNGGSLVIVPSSGENADNINVLMTKLGLDTYGKSSPAGLRISELNMGHDLFKGVFDGIPKDIDLPIVRKYFPLQETATNWRLPLMKLQNGAPFLVMSAVGNGIVYYFTSPFEQEYTDFQKHPVIVPVFYQIAFLSQRKTDIQYRIGENSPIVFTGNVDNSFQSNELRIVNTELSAEIIPQVRNEGDRINLFVHNMIQTAGNYIIQNEKLDVQGLAFNFGREESEMKFSSRNSLDSIVRNHGLKNVDIMDANQALGADIQDIVQGKQLWKIFLYLALFFLAIEIILLRFWK